jgi:hypothetical protein
MIDAVEVFPMHNIPANNGDLEEILDLSIVALPVAVIIGTVFFFQHRKE